MHNGIINKTWYDDLEKLIKQISFTVKKPEGNLPENQFTIVKKSFKSSTKFLSLNSTIFVPKFYNFRRWTYSRNLLLSQNFRTL